jgi:predicted acylesterase/phospholipase RssA
MADIKKATDGPSPYSDEAFDPSLLPDFDTEFVDDEDIREFEKALRGPDASSDDLSAQQSVFITALNDWRPVHQRVRGRRKRASRKSKAAQRGKDETREGFVYAILKWPLLLVVFGWIMLLGALYLLTRLYIYLYEQFVTWRGKREKLRRVLQSTSSYSDWVKAAKDLDNYLGNQRWKETDEYAYYDYGTVRRVREQLRAARLQAEEDEKKYGQEGQNQKAILDLRSLLEASVKNNFVGVENPRLYSETYYGTKILVQSFTDEVEACMKFLGSSNQLDQSSKRSFFKHVSTNFGRSALCLSGGASFAYYHFGVIKALLDANLLPEVITGTSGGALVAALAATRTNEELKALLVPALAGRINACHDDFLTWAKRWYNTGARFDSLDWARRCSWFARGSMTFLEAYERTGRVLNVSCIPSDPHSPTILANYLTSPDCVIWSAVLASAAVPGILNPVVLMKKNHDKSLSPYSFGQKWRDGSLRTDIPLKALNLHFNVNFSIVSQVNPHINLFFFSSRGAVGRPVTHRRGRGWRGGFLGSATEQYLKLDLTKWLKVLRHLELLPRPMGQDWSEIWLQRFSGTITIWPKSLISDFYRILSDPSPQTLARMLHIGQHSTFPNLKFIANRMKTERLIDEGRKATRPKPADGRMRSILSEEDLQRLLIKVREESSNRSNPSQKLNTKTPPLQMSHSPVPESPSLSSRIGAFWQNFGGSSPKLGAHERHSVDSTRSPMATLSQAGDHTPGRRRGSGSIVGELGRQSAVFFDDPDSDGHSDAESGTEGSLVDGDSDPEIFEDARSEAVSAVGEL